MSQDELAVMDGGKCILQLRGVRPFLSDKYDITKHPNFKYTADADDKNAFDIEAFLSARLKLKPNEVCDVYEVDTKGAELRSALEGCDLIYSPHLPSMGHWRTKRTIARKNNEKGGQPESCPRKPGGRLFRLLYAYET